jgi:hypothetical protein
MFFSFFQGEVQSVQKLCWIMFIAGGGGHVVHGAHLLDLLINAGSFETSW